MSVEADVRRITIRGDCLVAIVIHGIRARVGHRSYGASLPKAKVTITEAERNVPHSVLTDDAGQYHLDGPAAREVYLVGGSSRV